MLLSKLAFRNLGRNTRRSLVTGTALALSVALCIAYDALADGMNVQLIHSLTRYDLGHLQVHAPGYTERHKLANTILDANRVMKAVRADPEIRAASARVYAAALVGAGSHSTGVELIGIDPRTESRVTELAQRTVLGHFLGPDPTPWPAARPLTAAERAEDARLTNSEARAAEEEIDELGSLGPGTGEHPPSRKEGPVPQPEMREAQRLSKILSPRPTRPPEVALGSSLARVLGVNPGDKLYLSTQAVDGVAEGIEARVVGVYDTGTSTYDRTRIYLHLRDLQRLVHLGDRIHEIAAICDSPDAAPAAAGRIAASLLPLKLDVRAWSQLRPDMVRMLDLNRAGGGMLAAIVFFVASLGVVNTMLMAVLERTRELGMLKALGMPATRIFAMVVTETALLALAGAVAGTAMGIGLDLWLVHQGLDLRAITQGVSMNGVGLAPVVHGAITPFGVVLPVVIVTGVCLAAAVYPAWRAARMQPAVGMRET